MQLFTKQQMGKAHLLFILFAVFIKGRVDAVVVFAVQVPAYLPQGFTEALEMVNFALPQELDGISYVGIVDQTQEIIIGGPCLLLWGRALNSSSL